MKSFFAEKKFFFSKNATFEPWFIIILAMNAFFVIFIIWPNFELILNIFYRKKLKQRNYHFGQDDSMHDIAADDEFIYVSYTPQLKQQFLQG